MGPAHFIKGRHKWISVLKLLAGAVELNQAHSVPKKLNSNANVKDPSKEELSAQRWMLHRPAAQAKQIKEWV